MKSEQERTAQGRFVQALQHEHLTCAIPGCGGPMDVTDHTPHLARIKTYEAKCQLCHTKEPIAGKEEPTPPWDGASITMMAEVHLLHEQPTCPFDDTPITFTSMPNPRRKAANACGRPVLTGPVEATVMGNILTQVRASGELKSLTEMRDVVRASTDMGRFEPKEDGAWGDAAGRFAALAK